MKVRVLLVLALAIGVFVNSATPSAQTTGKIYRLGVLSPSAGTIERMRRVMLPELARLGFTENSNLALDLRTGPREELLQLGREFATTRPDAVIAVGPAIRAMREGAPGAPIVGAFIGEDPIAAGFATSLAHPGGMITGIVMLAPELDAKRLFLLHEAVPGSRRIAALAVHVERDASNLAAAKEAADRAGIELLPFYAASADE